jgi:7,8-dihydropterin-6-yl-methyl-4-(beta-D-ribofuranosyl)aminobenzene 5'-phosphate synthase
MSDLLELDELRLLVVVDNETDTLSSVNPVLPQVPEAGHLAARSPVAHEHEGVPCKVVFDRLCCAAHGLSVLATGRRGSEEHTVLFDVGPYASTWLENAERLALDLSRIEAVFLSHWHADHSGGFPEVVGAIARARRRAGAPPPIVDLHPDRPDQRGVLHPSGTMLLLPPEPTVESLEAAGGVIRLHAETHTLGDGFFHASGHVPRLTPYETGLAGHHTFRAGRAVADPEIADERFLATAVRGRGVTLLSACSHAGIVNACLDARALGRGRPLDVVLGGYHLAGKAMEARIEATVRDLVERISPRVVAPGHCTGWRAKTALANAFSPGRYAPSVVGSLYAIAAE